MTSNEPGQPPIADVAHADPRPRRAELGTRDRRPPRRRGVRVRRDAGEVGGRRLHDPSPRVHRRLEGDVGPARRPGRGRGPPSGRAACRACRLGGPAAGEVHFLGYVDGELDSDLVARGRLRRSSPRRSDPTSCSATIRGSATGSTPTTGTPDGSRAMVWSPRGDPHFFPEHGLLPHRPRALMLFEADVPDHIEDVSANGRDQDRRARSARESVRVDDEGA